MGSVFVAEQVSTGRKRALKLMRPELSRDAKFRERFALEAKVGARIDSEHVVEVVGAGIDDATGAPWLAMELLDGEDLATMIARRGRLPLEEVVTLFEQLGHALSQAHAVGIVHRDLKPENLFIAKARRAGAPHLLKILDFGIAKLVSDVSATGGTTAAIGTPLWMAPEQAEVKAHIGPAADIWPLGLIAYHALTAHFYWRAAEESASVTALMKEILIDPIVSPSTRTAGLPTGFDAWFLHCVARDPHARFSSIQEAITAFTRLQHQVPDAFAATAPLPSTQAPPPLSAPSEPALPITKPIPILWFVAPVAVVALLGGAAFGIWNLVFSSRPVHDDEVGQRPAGTTELPGTGRPAPIDAPSVPSDAASDTDSGADAGSAPDSGVQSTRAATSAAVGTKSKTTTRLGSVTVNGQLTSAEVQRVVRQNFGRFTQCYENGLVSKPSLAGTVTVKFVIDRSGAVSTAQDGGSDLSDTNVVACVLRSVRNLSFPLPEGGIVTVVLPMIFSRASAAN